MSNCDSYFHLKYRANLGPTFHHPFCCPVLPCAGFAASRCSWGRKHLQQVWGSRPGSATLPSPCWGTAEVALHQPQLQSLHLAPPPAAPKSPSFCIKDQANHFANLKQENSTNTESERCQDTISTSHMLCHIRVATLYILISAKGADVIF